MKVFTKKSMLQVFLSFFFFIKAVDHNSYFKFRRNFKSNYTTQAFIRWFVFIFSKAEAVDQNWIIIVFQN